MDKWKKLFDAIDRMKHEGDTLSREDSIVLSRDNSLRMKRARDRKLGLSFAPKEMAFVSIHQNYKICFGNPYVTK